MIVHDDSFGAAIRSASGLANTTFEGTVTDRPDRYVSYTPRDTRSVSRFTGPQALVSNEYIVHSVGSTPKKAKQARELMLAAVLDQTLVTEGWKNKRVHHITSQPLALDKDIAPPLWYCTDVLGFDSEPT